MHQVAAEAATRGALQKVGLKNNFAKRDSTSAQVFSFEYSVNA